MKVNWYDWKGKELGFLLFWKRKKPVRMDQAFASKNTMLFKTLDNPYDLNIPLQFSL